MKRRFKSSRSIYKKGILRNNEKLIILTFSFITGLICGALTVRTGHPLLIDFINKLTGDSILAKGSQSVFNNFLAYFLPDFIAVIISCIFGLSVLGEPIICMIPLIRGMGIGLNIASIYSVYKSEGLLYALLLIMLPYSFSCASMIIACKENIITSRTIRKRLKSAQTDQALDYKMYAVRTAVILLIVFISSVSGSILCYLLFSKVNPLG